MGCAHPVPLSPDKLGWFIFISCNNHTRKNVMHTTTAMLFFGYALVPFVCFALRGLLVNGINPALGSPRSPKLSGWLQTDENYSRQWSTVWIKTRSKVYPTLNIYVPTVNGQTRYQVFLFFCSLSVLFNYEWQRADVCFHLKRKFRKFLMKERGKLGRGREEGRDREGERKGFAYQIDESAVLCHHAPDRF